MPIRPKTADEWLRLAVLGTMFAAAAAIPLLISLNRHFGQDDIEHLYASYAVASGRLLYKDLWQGHNPLLYHLYSLVVDTSDPVFTYRAARTLSLLFCAGQIALVHFSACRVSGRLASGIATATVLLQTAFCYHVVDIRPDVPGAFCVTAAYSLLFSRWRPLTVHVVQALMLSLGFLFSQKVAIACVVFGIWWLGVAWNQRAARLLLTPLVVWCGPVALYALYMVKAGNFFNYVRTVILDPAPVVARDATFVSNVFTNADIMQREIPRNLFYAVALTLAIGWGLWSFRTRPKIGFGAALCLGLILGLELNPFPYEYNHLTFVPTGGVLIGVLCADWAERWRVLQRPMPRLGLQIAPFLLSGATALPYLLQYTMPSSVQQRQLETIAEIGRVTAPDDAVFDQMGLYFRPNGHWQYIMNRTHVQRFEQGKTQYTQIEEEMARREVVAVTQNYRTRQLERRRPSFARFVSRHFVHYDGNIFLQGAHLEGMTAGQSVIFEALKSKPMVFQGTGQILLDGAPFVSGSVSKGEHKLTAVSPQVDGKLILAAPLVAAPRPPGILFLCPVGKLGTKPC